MAEGTQSHSAQDKRINELLWLDVNNGQLEVSEYAAYHKLLMMGGLMLVDMKGDNPAAPKYEDYLSQEGVLQLMEDPNIEGSRQVILAPGNEVLTLNDLSKRFTSLGGEDIPHIELKRNRLAKFRSILGQPFGGVAVQEKEEDPEDKAEGTDEQQYLDTETKILIELVESDPDLTEEERVDYLGKARSGELILVEVNGELDYFSEASFEAEIERKGYTGNEEITIKNPMLGDNDEPIKMNDLNEFFQKRKDRALTPIVGEGTPELEGEKLADEADETMPELDGAKVTEPPKEQPKEGGGLQDLAAQLHGAPAGVQVQVTGHKKGEKEVSEETGGIAGVDGGVAMTPPPVAPKEEDSQIDIPEGSLAPEMPMTAPAGEKNKPGADGLPDETRDALKDTQEKAAEDVETGEEDDQEKANRVGETAGKAPRKKSKAGCFGAASGAAAAGGVGGSAIAGALMPSGDEAEALAFIISLFT